MATWGIVRTTEVNLVYTYETKASDKVDVYVMDTGANIRSTKRAVRSSERPPPVALHGL